VEVLILHPGALGDILLSLPAIGALRRALPGARITLAANRDFADVVARGYAEEVISLSVVPIHRIHAGVPLPAGEIDWWRSFDRILSWTGAGDQEFERRMAELHSAALVARWRPRPGERVHVSALFVKSLEPWLGPEPAIEPARVSLPDAALEGGRRWLERCGWVEGRKTLALHPGAGSPEKRQPLSRLMDVARRWLARGDRSVVVIEGPAEPGLARDLAHGIEDSGVIEATQLPLAQLAAVLSLCQAFSGNDSGISHMAAALGVKTRVWFRATDPEVWRPPGALVSRGWRRT
jgi:ADP-heptose:LPS heptosyltransferase